MIIYMQGAVDGVVVIISLHTLSHVATSARALAHFVAPDWIDTRISAHM